MGYSPLEIMEIITIVNDEDGCPLVQVEAQNLESFYEQLRKVEKVVSRYQSNQKDIILTNLCQEY